MGLLLFVVWIVAEVAAALAVAHFVGALICILLLVAGWPVGGWLLRAEGRAAAQRLRTALAAGRAPGPELADGALALLAGPLFIIPGFVTDVLALALLVPGLRGRLGGWLLRHAQGRVVTRMAGFARGARRPYDVDGTASDAATSSRPGDRPHGSDPHGLLHG